MNSANEAEPAADPKPTAVARPRRVILQVIQGVVILAGLLAVIGVMVYRSAPRVSVLISAGLWLAMDIYWSLAETKRHDTKTKESANSRRVHGLLTTGALVLLFAPIRGLTGQFVPDTLTTAVVGLSIQIAFNLFYIYARLYLGKLWSGAITIMAGHELIQTGPYRFLRHPMYTGMLGMAAGTAVVSGQYHALLGVALFMLAYARKIRMEERVLAGEFGEPYVAYRRRTAALIPWVL
jgi:protein-S-isoprenylcysteine O-methyltransferase Ste14